MGGVAVAMARNGVWRAWVAALVLSVPGCGGEDAPVGGIVLGGDVIDFLDDGGPDDPADTAGGDAPDSDAAEGSEALDATAWPDADGVERPDAPDAADPGDAPEPVDAEPDVGPELADGVDPDTPDAAESADVADAAENEGVDTVDGGDPADTEATDAGPDVVEPPANDLIGRLSGAAPGQLFTLLSDGDTLEITQGPQGGIHLEVAVELAVPSTESKLIVGLTCTTHRGAEQVGSVFFEKYVIYAAAPAVFRSQVLPVFFVEADATAYEGQSVAVRCEVRDLPGGAPPKDASVSVSLVDLL